MQSTSKTSSAVPVALLTSLVTWHVAALEPARGGGQRLEEIVVTADALRRGADVMSQAVSVLDEQALRQRPLTNIGELLDGLPGIANADFGPGVGRPVVRGLQGARVRTLEDGLFTADVAGEGADHAVAIDPARAQQIEVYRGPATLLYGSGATGGVVNVRTRRFDPVFESRARLRGLLSYGENGNDRQGYVGADLPTGENVVVRADASVRRAADFAIRGFQELEQTEGRKNRLVNSSVETESYSLSGLWRGDLGYIGLGISTWQTDYGIPENFDARPRELGGQSDEFERIVAAYDRMDLRGELEQPLRGIRALRFAAAYTRFEQEEIEFEFARTPAGGELEDKVVEAEFGNDEGELRVEFEHEPVRGWSGVFGMQYSDRDFTAGVPGGEDENFFIRPNRTRTAGLFLLEEREVAWGHIEWSTRIERQTSRPAQVSLSEIDLVTGADGNAVGFPFEASGRNFTAVSVSAGAVRNLDDTHRLQLVVSRAQRMPSPEQMYAFGRHPAAGTFEVGDLDLAKETYLNLDVGVERHVGPLRYEARLFYSHVDDFIFLRSVDDGTGRAVFVNDLGSRFGEAEVIGCGPDDGGLCRLRNQLVFNQQRDARLYGAELSSAYDLVSGTNSLTLRFSGDFLRGELRGGENLPRMTPARLGLGIDMARGDLQFSTDLRHVFRQGRTGQGESSSSGFNLLSLTASWSPTSLAGGALFLQGRNLLNESGRLHQSFFRNQAPIVGRAMVAGVRFDIGP